MRGYSLSCFFSYTCTAATGKMLSCEVAAWAGLRPCILPSCRMRTRHTLSWSMVKLDSSLLSEDVSGEVTKRLRRTILGMA